MLEDADREALAHAAPAVDALVLPRLEGDALDDLEHEIGEVDRPGAALDPRFLARDLHAELDGARIVGQDLGADAVLERRDDLAARGVVLGVGGEAHEDIERQPDGIALNLDVALLHDVEEADLDLAAQVGQLVDGEDAAIGARQQAVVHAELVGEQVPAARRLDGVEVADHVGDGDVGRGELLDVAILALEPGNRRGITALGDEVAAELADRAEGIVIDLAAGDDRDGGVEQLDEAPAGCRVLACPRRPSRMKSCWARTALTIWGSTVSS